MEDSMSLNMPTNKTKRSDDLNEVVLSGAIVGKYETDSATRITLGINTSSYGNLYSNYPSIYFHKKDGINVDDFRLHDKVDILAAAISTKKTLEDGTEFKRQGLCGVEIKKAGEMYEPRKLYFRNAEKKYYFIGLNKTYLEGKVAYINRVGEGMYDYWIKNMRNGKINFIHLLQYTETKPDIPEGTRIAIDAWISTRKKGSGEEVRHFQDLIVNTVRILD